FFGLILVKIKGIAAVLPCFASKCTFPITVFKVFVMVLLVFAYICTFSITVLGGVMTLNCAFAA
ncbi:hypothetical protein, partial [Ochrovirga pacifica]|uniref:hypothetical protein n=1 Tax=Ochrovirga pacifica TaxID=1042376 RepID=UPI0002557F51